MKNILKSIFVAIFPVFALYVLTRTLFQFNFNTLELHRFGNLISSFTILFFLARLFFVQTARTSILLFPYTITIAIGFVLNLIKYRSENNNSLIINSVLLICWLLYIFWYSAFTSRDHKKLSVGNLLPNFELEDPNGNTVSSNSFIGKPSVFLFYRGNWCPLCMAQIQEIVNQYKELERRNVHMVLISSQPHKFTNGLAKKYKIPFHFLVDSKNKVAKQLGILDKNGLPTGFQVLGYSSDVILPTVIITDLKGTIIFADLTDNYRVRPEPSTFLEVIDRIKE